MSDIEASPGDSIHISSGEDWCDEWFYLGTANEHGYERALVGQRYADGSWYATTVQRIGDDTWHKPTDDCRLNGPYYEETPYDDS